MSQRFALLSVSDRAGLEPFARGLRELGFTLLVTSGTGKALKTAGIETLSIEEYTGQREFLDGRVKTLHPKIHAGLLARRDRHSHMADLAAEQVAPIDVVAVNLYPFLQAISGVNVAAGHAHGSDEGPLQQMVELIDVGGPTMLRAASKNFHSVYSVIDPADYSEVLRALDGEQRGSVPAEELLALRKRLAAKVFTTLAADNLAVANFLAGSSGSEQSNFSNVAGAVLSHSQSLRYGENSHQKAALFAPQIMVVEGGKALPSGKPWKQLHGKELSYNNLLDVDAALRIGASFRDTDKAFVSILKHLNPCGSAFGDTAIEALLRAKRCDPRSHFGGIIVTNKLVDMAFAQEVRGDFAEIVIAPSFAPDALAELQKNKNLRLVAVDSFDFSAIEMRSIVGGVLIQESDKAISDISKEAEIVSRRKPTPSELRDLDLAWRVCANVKSNAIVIAKEGMTVGVGAGQMSRVDSVELAIKKSQTHGHNLTGAVAASDAFFPFPDGPTTLAQAGITAIVAPRGAKRDDETIAAADNAGISLLFVADRHFRH